MKKWVYTTLSALVGMTLAGHAQAQLYRIVAPDGTVTYSDRPLTTGAAPLGKASATASAPAAGTASNSSSPSTNTQSLPYPLRQATAKYPVVLYSGNSCTPCDGGRGLLQTRGIPFTERTITTREDVDALKRQMGDDSLPYLTVGNQKIKGFSSDEWQQYLDAAGYPTRSMLPVGYKNPPASALVTVKKREEPKPQEVAPTSTGEAGEEAPPPTPSTVEPNKPRGFVF